jgi:hypothetical protein
MACLARAEGLMNAKAEDWRPYTNPWREKRHKWLQADGSWMVCGGPTKCKQCIIDAAARHAKSKRKD